VSPTAIKIYRNIFVFENKSENLNNINDSLHKSNFRRCISQTEGVITNHNLRTGNPGNLEILTTNVLSTD